MSDSPRAHVLRPVGQPEVRALSRSQGGLTLALASSPPPSCVGYRVIRLLDEGGMAKLFLAHRLLDHHMNDLVVLKQVRSFVARDHELRRMFLDEVRLGMRLSHPNVVTTLGSVEDGDSLAMVMEYLDGQSYARARDRLERNDPGSTLALSLRVLSEVCAGLDYAHQLRDDAGKPLSVVHRDVSPQNVLLTYDGRVKVLDFGLARDALRSPSDPELMSGGPERFRGHSSPDASSGGPDRLPVVAFKGKLAYAAPEQVAGGAVDARTDLFSLGVMLWEALAGRRLWQGMDNAEIHARLLRHAWPSLREVAPDADRELVSLAEAAMHGRPDARPATAGAFRACLDAARTRLQLEMPGAQAGKLLTEAFSDERDELRAQLLEYFEGASAESGFYPAAK